MQIQNSYCEISNKVYGHYICSHLFIGRLLESEVGWCHEKNQELGEPELMAWPELVTSPLLDSGREVLY